MKETYISHLPPHTYFPAQRSRPGAAVPIPGKATDLAIRHWLDTMRLDLLRFARLNDRGFACNVDDRGVADDGEIMSLADMVEVVCGPGMLDIQHLDHPQILDPCTPTVCPTCDGRTHPHGGPECPACAST